MKKLLKLVTMFFVLMSVTSLAYARNTEYMQPIPQDVNSGPVKFYFGNQQHPRVVQNFGQYTTNPKSRSIGKSDARACNRAFQSALLSFQKRAQSLGANAVINIVNYYKKNPNSNNSAYECHAGTWAAGVALKGDVVKLAR
ncbi:MAG TPA: excinuclease ATPase subunit [Gammaproteobacteria bacterium]|nr:excinuclease ATPase subunit [Gammaproteobacteria bacterium]